MGYSYDAQYKKGKDNVAVDTLSRLPRAEVLLLAISAIQSDLLELVKEQLLFRSNLAGLCLRHCYFGAPIQPHRWISEEQGEVSDWTRC